MQNYAIIQIGIFSLIIILLTKPIGIYLYRVFNNQKTILDPICVPIEKLVYKMCSINPSKEMHWLTFTISMLVFNFVGFLILYLLLRLQNYLPLNPQHIVPFSPDLALNTSVSFVTNTNWQNYSGESTASYLTQMLGLAVQNFLSAAVGLAIAIAIIRGFTRRSMKEIGNFWVDLTKSILWVLLPGSIILAVLFIAQGVLQNLSPYLALTSLEGKAQILAMGPVASQLAIKMLGTNGGGFFNANSAHPFENPTPFSNLLQMIAIFAIPAGLTYCLGLFAKDVKQGWVIFYAMFMLFALGLSIVIVNEQTGNPILTKLGADQSYSQQQSGGNMEGKEVRFGITNSSMFATVTTDASCGAVNSMHDSYTPLAGGTLLLNIALGELIFGGVGAGLIGILIYVLLSVFIAGLMVGRTPEYLGKKIGNFEVKMAMISVLIIAFTTLIFTAVAVVSKTGLDARLNMGPHGLSELLYAFTSASGNNGSAFAGLSANSTFFNITLAFAMWIGRFFFLIPMIAVAGSMAKKNISPVSIGTFPTNDIVFTLLLVGVILIVGALTYFPVLALGPIVEHIQMNNIKTW